MDICDGVCGGDPLAGGALDGDRRRGRLGSAAEARTEEGEVGPMAGAWLAARVVGAAAESWPGAWELGPTAGTGRRAVAREVGVAGGAGR
jgi:hypothetical protein